MFGAKVYELPLARDYVSNWGVVQAVRELLQNAIDSPSPFDVRQVGAILTIESAGARLDVATLVLGRTSKAADVGSIGQFGEGYKLALLVLAREGKTVVVTNGDVSWRPEFRRSAQFNIETLHIVEERLDKPERIDGVRFAILNLDGDEQAAIKASCLHMQDIRADAIQTPFGEIHPSLPGKLYVGGLFVCDTQLDFGYNLNPGEIDLERDRQTVGTWDLKSKTKNVWLSTGQYETMAEMIDRNTPDVAHAEYGSPEILKEACYKHFRSKHPGKVIAKNQEELEGLIERGLTVYIGGSNYYANVHGSASYQREHPVAAPNLLTPSEVLVAWFNENSKYMPRMPKASFKKVLEKAQKWKVV